MATEFIEISEEEYQGGAGDFIEITEEEFNAPAEEPDQPFFALEDAVSAIGTIPEALSVGVPAAFQKLVTGTAMPEESEAIEKDIAFQERMRQEQQDRQAAGKSSMVGEAIREAAPSISTSFGGLGAGIAGAVGGTVVGGPVGGTVGGMAASGTASYRMAAADLLYRSFKALEEQKGSPLTEEEKAQAYKEFLPLAQNSALWEAGPEAVSNAVLLGAGKFVFGFGKPLAKKLVGESIERVNKGIASKVAAGTGAVAAELGTETITALGQFAPEMAAQKYTRTGTTEGAPTEYPGGAMQAFKDVAPATLALTGMMAGAGGVAKAATLPFQKAKTPEQIEEDNINLDADREADNLLIPDNDTESKSIKSQIDTERADLAIKKELYNTLPDGDKTKAVLATEIKEYEGRITGLDNTLRQRLGLSLPITTAEQQQIELAKQIARKPAQIGAMPSPAAQTAEATYGAATGVYDVFGGITRKPVAIPKPAELPAAPTIEEQTAERTYGGETGVFDVFAGARRKPVEVTPTIKETLPVAEEAIISVDKTESFNQELEQKKDFNPPALPSLQDARSVPDKVAKKGNTLSISGGSQESIILNNEKAKKKFDAIGYDRQEIALPDDINEKVSEKYGQSISNIKSIFSLTWLGAHFHGGIAVSKDVKGTQRGRVVAHELGHASHSLLGDQINKDQEVLNELARIEELLYPGLREKIQSSNNPDTRFFNYLLSADELIAEFNVERITNPEQATQVAPKLISLLESVEKDNRLVADRKAFPVILGAIRETKERLKVKGLEPRQIKAGTMDALSGKYKQWSKTAKFVIDRAKSGELKYAKLGLKNLKNFHKATKEFVKRTAELTGNQELIDYVEELYPAPPVAEALAITPATVSEAPTVTEAPAAEVAPATQESFGQRMLNAVNEKIAQGKDVFISTMTKSTKVNKKAVDNWNKAGKPLFKVGKDGNLYIGSGKRYDQLTSADMSLVGFSSEGKKLVVAEPTPAVSETITPATVVEPVKTTTESQVTTDLRNKLKAAKGKDRQIVVMQAIAEGTFSSSAIEAAEYGKPFPSIDKKYVSEDHLDGISSSIDTSKIILPTIKAKPPEEAASQMISLDDGRPVLAGTFFDSKNNMIVATDGRALVAIPQKITGGDKVIAGRNIKEKGSQKAIKKGDLIEGNYPNWKQVVPTYEKDIQKVDIDIVDALKASTILDSINKTFKEGYNSSVILFNGARFDPKYILSSITALVESGAKSITAQIKSEADPLLLTGDNGAIAVVMPIRINGRIFHLLKAKSAKTPKLGEKGGVLIPSREDFIQAGQNIYEAGMEFGTWAKQMIQRFGDAVRQFLGDVWEAVSGFPAKLEEMAGYLPGKGERGAVTFGRGEEPPKKPAEPAPEKPAEEKPITDPATPDEQTQQLVQQAQEQESLVDSAVKEAGTTVFDVFNKLVNEGKTEDQVAKELGISNYDVRKYKLRADTAILNKMKQKKVKPLAFAPKNPVAEFAEKNLRKYFTKEGWLPKAVFQSWVKRNAALSREQKEAEFAIKDLYAGIREVFGISKMEMITKGLVSVPPEFVQQLNDAMAKKIDINTMPEPVREPLTRMRQHIDAMSRQLVDLNVLPDELSAKISENLGVYLTRSYKIFTDKNWINKIPAEKLTAARNFLYQQQLKNDPEATIEMADRELRNMLNDWASDAEGLRKRGGKLGAKDLSVMMERAKVPKVLREVMGENTNVIFNYANTIGKISRFVSDQKFLNEVKAKGTGEFLFTEKDAPKGFNTQIAAEESRTMSPLNGLRTTPEIAKAFEEFGKGYDARENPGLYVLAWLNAVGKLNLTVGSVLTQMRNMLGQPAFFVFNGHYNWRVIRQEIDAIAKEKGISQEDAKKELVKLAAAQGLVNENAYAGELRTAFQEVGLETFDDIGPDEFTKQFVLTRMYLKGVKSAQELYQKTDEFGKIVGWLNETKRIQRMNKGMDKQTAQSIAAERTRDTYPTYSQSSEALRLFRRQPFVGPFATFFYETFRTSFHNLRYAFEDINGPTPEHKAEGIKRLAGAMTTLSMGAFGINLISKLASGIGDDEEEDVRRMLPPWAKDASLAWMPKSKDGTYNFINVSYINPYNAMTDPFIAMMSGFAKGDKPEEIAAQALGSFLSPFASEQPVTATIGDAARNRTSTGKQIYNPQDDITTKTSKIMLHIFGKTFTPGTINRLRERIIPAIQGETVGTRAPAPAKEIAAELTGIRFETLDMKAAFSSKAWEFSRAANESERIFRDVATRRRRVDEQEQVDAYRRSEQTRYEIWNDMYRDYMAVRRAGASQGEAVRLMTDIGISKKEAIAISKGRYVPYEVSNEVLRRSKLNENKVPIKEIRVIGKEMPRVLTDITKTP